MKVGGLKNCRGVYNVKCADRRSGKENKKMEAREKNDFLGNFWAKNGHFQKKIRFLKDFFM